MTSIQALGRLRKLNLPALFTNDAAAVLGVSSSAASHLLARLVDAGLMTAVRKGAWAFGDKPDPLAMVDYVTAPYPSYVSLQTALYRHGMINQIPSMTYLVSLARTARVTTPIATYSVHHVQPAFFDGFDFTGTSGIKLATPEKALVDFFYLSPARSRLFAALPELELPRKFRASVARGWVKRIPSARLRTLVNAKLDEALHR